MNNKDRGRVDVEEGDCDVCGGEPEADEQESHKYEKHHSTSTGPVRRSKCRNN